MFFGERILYFARMNKLIYIIYIFFFCFIIHLFIHLFLHAYIPLGNHPYLLSTLVCNLKYILKSKLCIDGRWEKQETYIINIFVLHAQKNTKWSYMNGNAYNIQRALFSVVALPPSFTRTKFMIFHKNHYFQNVSNIYVFNINKILKNYIYFFFFHIYFAKY